jgi:hypothetical protein
VSGLSLSLPNACQPGTAVVRDPDSACDDIFLPRASTCPVRRTLRIICEAVTPSVLPAGAQGRHLSLPFGCRPELRQLHPLVRPRPPNKRSNGRTRSTPLCLHCAPSTLIWRTST